jgi:hypothetical protein
MMDRRDFLKAAAAIPTAAYLPAVEARPVLNAAAIKAAITGYQSGPWYVILHPSQARDLRDIAARERWHTAHLAWRKDGKPPMDCQQILEKYTPIHTWDVDVTGEVGSYEGYRFIESETVPHSNNVKV